MMKAYVAVFAALLLTACSSVEIKPGDGYQLAGREHLYQQKTWLFEGRLAVTNKDESMSANVVWRHGIYNDEIVLSGPLAQGKVQISVLPDKVIIDDGNQHQEYTDDVQQVFIAQFNVDMPIAALKFWVLGLVEPEKQWTAAGNGFLQHGWRVIYKEMQQVKDQWLPYKINAENPQTKIKLIVDQWSLS